MPLALIPPRGDQWYFLLVCVCVCVLSSHLFWTSALWTHQPGHTGGRSYKIYREKDSAIRFPRRPWSRILYPRINHSPSLVGHVFLCHFFVSEAKSQFVWLHRDSDSLPNVIRFGDYQLNNRGERYQRPRSKPSASHDHNDVLRVWTTTDSVVSCLGRCWQMYGRPYKSATLIWLIGTQPFFVLHPVSSRYYCFLTLSALVANPKNYFTRWPIPLVVCWTGKKKNKSGSAPPPPPRALLVRRKKIKKSRDKLLLGFKHALWPTRYKTGVRFNNWLIKISYNDKLMSKIQPVVTRCSEGLARCVQIFFKHYPEGENIRSCLHTNNKIKQRQ